MRPLGWVTKKNRTNKTQMGKRNRNQQYEQPEEDRQDRLQLEGVVAEALPGTLFRIKCTTGNEVMCTLSGKLRINKIRLLPGDTVAIEVSPYDLSRGRVTWRR